MKKLLFFAFTILLISCTNEAKQECIDQSKVNAGTMCKDDYVPVCGCDGKEYSNVCRAKSAGVTSWDEGKCPEKH